MTMLMKNEQAMHTNSGGKNTSRSKLKSSINTPSSNAKGPSSSRSKYVEQEGKKSQVVVKNDLEEYLRHSRNTGSRNFLNSGGKTAKTHASYMHAQKSYR